MMKKVWIILLGALLATVALQGCSSDKADDQSTPAVIDDSVDTPAVPSDPGQIVLATLELGLGGADGTESVVGRTQQAVDLSGGAGVYPYNTDFIGLGMLDVGITGAGLSGGAQTACPNSLDPLTGLPLAVDPCAVSGRGTFTGSAITTALTVTNNTGPAGSLGSCALYANSICTLATDCAPDVVGGGNFCMGNLVYLGSGLGSGFCNNGTTACLEANSDAAGINTTCAGIGGGTCWTGCGACVGGRDLNCVAIRYLSSQAVGSATNLDALGNVKCSGGPYGPTQAGVDGVENIAPGTADSWYVGQVGGGIAQGGSATETISIDSANNSYCVHQIQVLEDPRGNVASADCNAQCGDGIIADNNGEICEPAPGTITNVQRGCPTGLCANAPLTPCSAATADVDCGMVGATCGAVCNACTACVAPVLTCGNGLLDAGEQCDLSVAGTVCCSAVCTFKAAGAADAACVAGNACNTDTCNGAGACTGAVPVANGTACGSAVVTECDLADSCQAGVCAANNVAGGTSCGGGVAQPTCNPDTCNGAGVCTDAPSLDSIAIACAQVPGGDSCCAGLCADRPIPGNCGGAVVTATPTARRGTSLGHAGGTGDFNNGLTGGTGGANFVYTILPNDPAATASSGTDLVVFDIAIANGPLAAQVVACTVGGIPATTDCGAGDAVCKGWGVHPQVTGGGLNTVVQSVVAPGAPGIGVSVAPDETATATNMNVTCTVDAANPMTDNIDLAMGFVGVQDKVVAAGTAAVDADFIAYCSNGTGGGTSYCAGYAGGGPVGGDVQRGLQLVMGNMYYDPAVFTAGPTGTVVGKVNRNAAVPYGSPANGLGCDTIAPPATCTALAPGVTWFQSRTIPCNGTILWDAGGCTLGGAVGAAGTETKIDVAALDAGFLRFTADLPGFVIRGVDNDDFVTPAPSTNVTGYVIWN